MRQITQRLINSAGTLLQSANALPRNDKMKYAGVTTFAIGFHLTCLHFLIEQNERDNKALARKRELAKATGPHTVSPQHSTTPPPRHTEKTRSTMQKR